MRLTKKEIQAENDIERAEQVYLKELKAFELKTAEIKKALENYFKGAVISEIRLSNNVEEQWIQCKVKYPPEMRNKQSGYHTVFASCLRRPV